MQVLIVHAHEEPKSFNGAMRDLAVRVLTEAGHEVTVSDLYAMRFDPVGGRRDFTRLKDSEFFKYGVEQAHATRAGTFAPDVADEQRKVFAADFVIFQFPLWWFGLPAILKGWVDRVFAAGLVYGGGKWYSNGAFRGKRAMLALTTGGGPAIYSARGLNGDMEQILFPINHGILYFTGFDVLPPFVAWSPARITAEQRARCLDEYRDRLLSWQTATPIPYHPLTDYDENFELKPGL